MQVPTLGLSASVYSQGSEMRWLQFSADGPGQAALERRDPGSKRRPHWSPDGSALLFTGIAGMGWATYMVPSAGGATIRVAPECAILSSNGRSLLWTAEMGRGDEHHVEVGGLPNTRFVVRGYAEYFMLETAVPESRWIIVRIDAAESRNELRAVNLTGREGGSFLAKGLDAGAVLASRDAVWMQVCSEMLGTVNILRIPFDPQTWQFGAKADTVYTGDEA